MRAIEPQDPTVTIAAVLDALPIATLIARPDGTISYLSRGWAAVVGTQPSDVLGQGFSTVIHPDQREPAVATWLIACAAETPYHDELLFHFGDGSYRWVRVAADPIRNPVSGVLMGWLGTIINIDEQKRNEERLRAQLEFSERLIDSSDDCIKILDLDALMVSLSPNGQRALGISDPDTVIGTSWIDFWQGADRSAARRAVETALQCAIGRFTGCYAVKGQPRWFDVVVTAILDASGRPERLLAVSRDVTLQRRAAEELAESEQRYRALSEALPGITWSASAQGELEFISAQWARTRGRKRDDALGFGWLDAVHAEDRPRASREWRASIATGAPYEIQFRVRMADGTFRWQLVRALPVRDEGGAIKRWIGVNIDIDEQRRADAARDKFVAVVENSSDFIGIADRDGNAMYVNEAGRRLLDIGSPEAAQVTKFTDLFCAADRQYVRSEILPALERDGRWIGDFQFRNFLTGAPVPVAFNFFQLFDRSGTFTGVATVSRDRRRNRRIEAGLALLARTGAAVLDSLDYMATLRNVAAAFVPDFAAYCIIDVIPARDRWQRTAVHRDPSQEALLLGLSEPSEPHPTALALEAGTSSLILIDENWLDAIGGQRDRIDAVRRLGVRSFVTVPVIMPSGEIVGGLTCARDASDRIGDFDSDELAFVQEAGRRAGAAIANTRLYERERRIAVELQAASLPATLPRVDHLHLDAEYRPGSDEATIGGDWYDAFVLKDGRVAITVGDVLGHGLHAAVTMTKLRQSMQAAAMVNPDPNVMLAVADETLRLLNPDGYATALAAIYDRNCHTLTFASAGHPGPIVRTSDGRVANYESPGLMLGLRSGAETNVVVVPTPPQCTMVFYTDGLVEATRDLDAGTRRLHEALSRTDVFDVRHPARAIVEFVLGTVAASDDIAVLVAYTGSRAETPASPELQTTYTDALPRSYALT